MDKMFHEFLIAYNLQVEAEWNGPDHDEEEGEVVQSLGASFHISGGLFLGAEALYEIPLPDWHSGAHQNLFVGPDLSYHSATYTEGQRPAEGEFGAGNWALTVAPLIRVTGGDEEPAFQLRVLFEMDF